MPIDDLSVLKRLCVKIPEKKRVTEFTKIEHFPCLGKGPLFEPHKHQPPNVFFESTS